MADEDARRSGLRRTAKLGAYGVAFGIASLLGVAMIWATSVVADFNPPGWLRIPVMALFPIGALGSLLFGVLGLSAGGRRSMSAIALTLCAASVGVFVYLISTLG